MTFKNKIILYCSLAAIVAAVILINFVSSEIFSFKYWNPIKKVAIKNAVVKAEIVSSDAKIKQGLAGRKELAPGRGMLFMMPADTIQQFWMKGMQFPIDIIWIEKGYVIGCERNILPGDNRIFASPGFSSMVLEVNKGFCDEHGISSNDPVSLQ